MTGQSAPKGVYAAVSTPVTASFAPDLPRFLDHCRWLLKNGCDGLAPLGTTGEANSLHPDDRIRLLQAMNGAGLPMDRVIVGTGSPSLLEAVRLSVSALDSGADKLLMLPPFYYKEVNEEGLFRFFAGVIERIRSERPERKPRIFLYHIPQMSMVPITLPLVTRLRAEFPGVIVGMKDSGGDFEYTRTFIDAVDGFEAFSGSETLAAATLDAGGWGCISATTNVSAPVVANRLTATDLEVRARLDAEILRIRSIIAGCHTVSGTKAVLARLKRDSAWARTLPPNVEPPDETVDRLMAELGACREFHRHFGDAP
ncbi:MAG: dihydrodipicolinate synthase family protein [Paracoccaceae bacterium]|nr:dihydrodipicolinate synthase family protein [Paracoccaceae bacterium]